MPLPALSASSPVQRYFFVVSPEVNLSRSAERARRTYRLAELRLHSSAEPKTTQKRVYTRTGTRKKHSVGKRSAAACACALRRTRESPSLRWTASASWPALIRRIRDGPPTEHSPRVETIVRRATHCPSTLTPRARFCRTGYADNRSLSAGRLSNQTRTTVPTSIQSNEPRDKCLNKKHATEIRSLL